MNHWGRMLADLPAQAQRTIARSQRISLPHGADATTRVARLRRALCPAPSVRATYAVLPPAVQVALQELRAQRGGLSPDQVIARFGPIRPWTQLATDRTPQSVGEQLVLLGWLCFRPARAFNPARYLLPPELRRALPTPLPTAPEPHVGPPALALRAAATLLLACAEQPRRLLNRACAFPRPLMRALAARLAPLEENTAAALLQWLLPILVDGALLAAQNGRAHLTLVGERWLAADADAQLFTLRRLWVAAPTADTWLRRLRVALDGIDWPVLRRRLLDWAAHAAPDAAADPATSYALLAGAFGPLGDAHTHGWCTRSRAPWHPRRAAAVWAAALRGPLSWLAAIGNLPASSDASSQNNPGGSAINHGREKLPPLHPYRMRRSWATSGRPRRHVAVAGWAEEPVPLPTPALQAPDGSDVWAYEAPGVVRVPHTTTDALRLLPYVRWQSADAQGTCYRLTPATLAHAGRQGYAHSACVTLLQKHAGPLPATWQALLKRATPDVRLISGPLLVAQPTQLTALLHQRTVRRAVERLGPGVAQVRVGATRRLARCLARAGIPWEGKEPDTADDGRAVAVPGALAPGERAALAVACAFYGRHAPPDAPLLPHAALMERLRGGLPTALGQAVDTALRELAPAAVRWPSAPVLAAEQVLIAVQAALAGQQLLELTYDTGGRGVVETRQVQPQALEVRDTYWYLRAYCQQRQAARTFRLDRIHTVRVVR